MTTELATPREDLPSAELATAISDALEGLKAIRTFVKQQFLPGVDAGTIPGCGDKPTLLLPGAQKATMYFNAFPTYKVKEKDLGGGHVEYRVRALLVSRATGQQIGEGLGTASTREKKFKRANKQCPTCGVFAIKKGSEKYGGGWYCDRKADGCGAKFADNHKAMARADEVVTEEAAFEMHNTVLKMAKKRAHVDAAMTLGCLSELFTQDIEDTYPVVEVREAARPPEPEPTARPRDYRDGRWASPEQTQAYLDKIIAFCERCNSDWCESWVEPYTGEIPGFVNDLINKFRADKHLTKWCVETGRLDFVNEEEIKVAQLGRYTAMVFHRSKEDAKAMRDELRRYVAELSEREKERIYRKHPEVAPPGYFGDDEPEDVQAADGEAGPEALPVSVGE